MKTRIYAAPAVKGLILKMILNAINITFNMIVNRGGADLTSLQTNIGTTSTHTLSAQSYTL